MLTSTRLFCVDVCRRESAESPNAHSSQYSFQDVDLLTARSVGSMGFGRESEDMNAGFLMLHTVDSAALNGIGSYRIIVDILDSSCVQQLCCQTSRHGQGH
jgi:hypothetical protein